MSEIYRKSSLEKLESPDHLDKMVTIISPSAGVFFFAGIIVIISLIVWSIFGQVIDYDQLPGIYKQNDNNAYNSEKVDIVCYTLLKDSKNIKEGMKVSIVPLNVNEKEYGHMTGIVTNISSDNVTHDEMINRLGNNELVQYFNNYFSNDPIVQVGIKLDQGDTVSGYEWSNKKGNKISIDDNMLVSAKVVLDVDKPINKILSSFSN